MFLGGLNLGIVGLAWSTKSGPYILFGFTDCGNILIIEFGGGRRESSSLETAVGGPPPFV